jgi:hypothetical protein
VGDEHGSVGLGGRQVISKGLGIGGGAPLDLEPIHRGTERRRGGGESVAE